MVTSVEAKRLIKTYVTEAANHYREKRHEKVYALAQNAFAIAREHPVYQREVETAFATKLRKDEQPKEASVKKDAQNGKFGGWIVYKYNQVLGAGKKTSNPQKLEEIRSTLFEMRSASPAPAPAPVDDAHSMSSEGQSADLTSSTQPESALGDDLSLPTVSYRSDANQAPDPIPTTVSQQVLPLKQETPVPADEVLSFDKINHLYQEKKQTLTTWSDAYERSPLFRSVKATEEFLKNELVFGAEMMRFRSVLFFMLEEYRAHIRQEQALGHEMKVKTDTVDVSIIRNYLDNLEALIGLSGRINAVLWSAIKDNKPFESMLALLASSYGSGGAAHLMLEEYFERCALLETQRMSMDRIFSIHKSEYAKESSAYRKHFDGKLDNLDTVFFDLPTSTAQVFQRLARVHMPLQELIKCLGKVNQNDLVQQLQPACDAIEASVKLINRRIGRLLDQDRAIVVQQKEKTQAAFVVKKGSKSVSMQLLRHILSLNLNTSREQMPEFVQDIDTHIKTILQQWDPNPFEEIKAYNKVHRISPCRALGSCLTDGLAVHDFNAADLQKLRDNSKKNALLWLVLKSTVPASIDYPEAEKIETYEMIVSRIMDAELGKRDKCEAALNVMLNAFSSTATTAGCDKFLQVFGPRSDMFQKISQSANKDKNKENKTIQEMMIAYQTNLKSLMQTTRKTSPLRDINPLPDSLPASSESLSIANASEDDHDVWDGGDFDLPPPDKSVVGTSLPASVDEFDDESDWDPSSDEEDSTKPGVVSSEDVDRLTAQIHEQIQEIGSLNADLGDARTQLELAQNEVIALEEKLNAWEALRGEYERLREESGTFAHQQGEWKTDLNRQQERISALELEIAQAESALAEANTAVTAGNEQLQSILAEMTLLQEALTHSEQVVSGINEEIAKRDNKITALEASNQGMAGEIKSLQASLASLKTQIETLTEEKTGLQETITSMNAAQAAALEKQAEAHQLASTADAEAIQTTISKLQASVEETEAALVKKQVEFNDQQKTLRDLTLKMAAQEATIHAQETKITELDAALTAQEALFSEKEKTLTQDAARKITALQETITSMNVAQAAALEKLQEDHRREIETMRNALSEGHQLAIDEAVRAALAHQQASEKAKDEEIARLHAELAETKHKSVSAVEVDAVPKKNHEGAIHEEMANPTTDIPKVESGRTTPSQNPPARTRAAKGGLFSSAHTDDDIQASELPPSSAQATAAPAVSASLRFHRLTTRHVDAVRDGNTSFLPAHNEETLSPALYGRISKQIVRLMKEIDSYWPYPNKDLKEIKAGLLLTLLEFAKDGSKADFKAALKTLQRDPRYIQAQQGAQSTRTKDLLLEVEDALQVQHVNLHRK